MQKLMLAAAVAAITLPAAAEAQTHDWTGFYAGVTAGQGREADFDLDAVLEVAPEGTFFPAPLAGGTFPTQRSFGGDGFVGGAHAGWNMQSGWLVLGGEVDLQTSDVGSSISIPNAPGGAVNNPDGFTDLSFGIDYYGTARARAGVAFDWAHVYGTGGVAYGKVEFDRNYRVGAAEIRDRATSNRTGWTVGAGAEYAVTDRISVRGEYSRVDLGSGSFDTAYEDGTIGRASIDTQFDVVRGGVSLRF
ncbi:outer membrane protein [Hyphomonas sp.]|uniref:outer membrane protein n=1 Tax=Hyphomonas sp. TaxID=87 RepID=UPI003918FFC0